jgi:hypothetical protein
LARRKAQLLPQRLETVAEWVKETRLIDFEALQVK